MNTKREVIGNVPRKLLGMMADLCQKLLHGNIKPIELELFLKKKNPFFGEAPIMEWQRFYRDLFGEKVDFSKIIIPEQQPDFDRLIIVAKGLTSNKVYNVCSKHFSCSRYVDDLDKAIVQNDRIVDKSSYAVRFRNRKEADEELKNLSANQLAEKSIPGITLLERLLYELKYWDETSKHLDVSNWTLCSGSRGSDGNVPFVYWDGGKLGVNWIFAHFHYDYLRSRAAVSCQPKAD